MGIVMELNARHYHSSSVQSNEFCIYLSTDEAADKLPSVLYDRIDPLIHFEIEKSGIILGGGTKK